MGASWVGRKGPAVLACKNSVAETSLCGAEPHARAAGRAAGGCGAQDVSLPVASTALRLPEEKQCPREAFL